jgi:hypothetical protein
MPNQMLTTLTRAAVRECEQTIHATTVADISSAMIGPMNTVSS